MSPPAIPLYGYQQRWLADRCRFKLGKFARQTGKTFTTTLEQVDDVFEGMTVGHRRSWVILSRGERQAAEAMNEGVKRHARAYGLGLSELDHDWQSDSGATYRALEVEFANGAKITALPSNPDTARGFSRSTFLDEFAFHKDSAAIWRAVFPIVSAGHKCRITSTPNGKGNKFYELDTAEDSIWSRHSVDIYQAVADGLPRDLDELRAGAADEDLWAQEYELQWLDEASAWLPYDLIFAAEHPAAGDRSRYTGGPVFLGNDIAAGGGDLGVLWVWELVGDVLWCREIIERRRATFAEQDQVMNEVFERYRVVRLAMDRTGMGEKPVEDATRRYGASRVLGVLFSQGSKLVLATQGKARFEDRKVRIPEGHIKLRADLHSLIKIVGETGAVRFVAPRQGGSHADRTWAAFLGIHAAELGHMEYAYTPALPQAVMPNGRRNRRADVGRPAEPGRSGLRTMTGAY